MLYFAYGSNLNHAQMEYRCAGATFIKKYILKGHEKKLSDLLLK